MPPAVRSGDAGRRLLESRRSRPPGPLDGSHVGRVLFEPEMSSRAGIVDEVAGQDAAQVPLAEHKDMVQTLTANRADEPLREGALPPAVTRRADFTDDQAPHALA